MNTRIKMKSILTVILLLFISFTFAQNIGFPYSTTIRDANGLAITNSSVIATAIIRPVGGGATAYSETHSATTDANGLLSIIVGEGAPTSGNTLADVDWGTASYEINVTTNPGTTNITFPIYSAPTALYSIEAGTAVNSGTATRSEPTEYLYAIALNQTLTTSSPVNYDPLSVRSRGLAFSSPGVFTLKAGKTYMLEASTYFFNINNWTGLAFKDSNGNLYGNICVAYPANSSSSGTIQPVNAVIVKVPSTGDLDMSLNFAAGQAFVGIAPQYSYLKVVELK